MNKKRLFLIIISVGLLLGFWFNYQTPVRNSPIQDTAWYQKGNKETKRPIAPSNDFSYQIIEQGEPFTLKRYLCLVASGINKEERIQIVEMDRLSAEEREIIIKAGLGGSYKISSKDLKGKKVETQFSILKALSEVEARELNNKMFMRVALNLLKQTQKARLINKDGHSYLIISDPLKDRKEEDLKENSVIRFTIEDPPFSTKRGKKLTYSDQKLTYAQLKERYPWVIKFESELVKGNFYVIIAKKSDSGFIEDILGDYVYITIEVLSSF